ncbi:MAG: ORF6N domain-containing protein, partial [Prevotella sp.]|nr:ORF6N domain-containing protein [Prevotella sp.]
MAKKTIKTANKQPVANCDQSSKPVTKCDQLVESSSQMAIDQLNIESMIHVIRDKQVMLDRDLAVLYGVETRRLNEQVRRNTERFPEDFMFQLTKDEALSSRSQFAILNETLSSSRSQIVTLKNGRGSNIKYLPYAFTESGIAMLSSVLRSPTAIEVNIRIMRAFVAMRHFLANNAQVFQRLANIEYHQIETDKRIDEVFKRLDANVQPQQGIFYDGQVFDAYQFVSDLVRKAKNSVVLIDNYVDDTVLTLLDKRANNVTATIYTQHISQQFQLDINRHNTQY